MSNGIRDIFGVETTGQQYLRTLRRRSRQRPVCDTAGAAGGTFEEQSRRQVGRQDLALAVHRQQTLWTQTLKQLTRPSQGVGVIGLQPIRREYLQDFFELRMLGMTGDGNA